MKKLTPLLFLLPLTLSGQIKIDHPELVYPVLEEFISEMRERGRPTLHKINSIDAIIVTDLGWDTTEPDFPKKNYGLHVRKGLVNTIYVDASLVLIPWRFERTLKHELGHVFGLQHLDDEKDEMQFMSTHHYIYYIEPLKWRQLNDSYYQSLNPPR